MHELSISQAICSTAKSLASEDQRIKRIVVEYGPFCGVVPESLDYCFSIIAEQMGLAGASLELRILSAKATCQACNARFIVESMWEPCRSCGHFPVTVEGGRDLRVMQIEVEEVS